MRSTLLTIFATALLLVAGDGKPADMTVIDSSTPTPVKPAGLALIRPPGHSDISTVANRNVSAVAASRAAASDLTGKVLETMNSGGYTYMKLNTPGGKVWTAVREMNVKAGATVALHAEMTMENFESATLHRKFDRIVFASIVSPAATVAPANVARASANPMGSAMQHMTAHPIANVAVEKATGSDGKTIAEIWSGKDSLKDKTVVLRGKVVKSLAGIMGKNWIHLRDGSGSREKGDDDITVTTNSTATVGDVVVVNGTLRADKDFGAGYVYAVIIEDAKLQK